jgi:hypothetical protein
MQDTAKQEKFIQKNIEDKIEEVYIVYLFFICLLLFIYGYRYCLFINFTLYVMVRNRLSLKIVQTTKIWI